MHTARELRESENNSCTGGLRNPNRAVAKSVDLQRVGEKIRRTLEDACVHPLVSREVDSAFNHLGDGSHHGFSRDVLWYCRSKLMDAFGVQDRSEAKTNCYQSKLWEALLVEASDPETDVPNWLRNGVPAGISNDINCNNVFPQVAARSRAVEQSRTFTKCTMHKTDPSSRNYASFHEAGDHATNELKRLVDKKYVREIGSFVTLLSQWPSAVVSKLACLLKQRSDGSWKVRFIIDLLRSGTNGQCSVPQRVVLPRVQDVANDILDLWEDSWNPWSWQADGNGQEDLGVEIGCVDFADAFYTLHLHPKDRGDWDAHLDDHPNGEVGCPLGIVFG